MTNRDLYSVALGVKKCSELVNIATIDFTMTMARINSEVQNELRIIEDGKKESSILYKEYLKKKDAIDIKYAIQREDGTFQTLNDSLLVRNPTEYYLEIDKLKEEYKEEINKVDSITKEFEKFLNQENTKISTKLSKRIIPAAMNVEQATLLFPVITD
jgi:hypothetical protein